MRELAPDVFIAEAPQRFLGLEVGARMTVLRLSTGLLVHSPIAVDPSTVAHLGEPRWVLAPNKLHHLHVGPWIDAGYQAWAAPGLPQKRPDLNFAGVISGGEHPFGAQVATLGLTCFDLSNEVVVLHRPSGTLIVTDLLFHFGPDAPWATRAAMRCLGGYPGCRTTLLEKVGMKRDIARREIAAILDWDFDRVVLAHGAVVEQGGKRALRDAFAWLGGPLAVGEGSG